MYKGKKCCSSSSYFCAYLQDVPLGETLGQRSTPWDQGTPHILWQWLSMTIRRDGQSHACFLGIEVWCTELKKYVCNFQLRYARKSSFAKTTHDFGENGERMLSKNAWLCTFLDRTIRHKLGELILVKRQCLKFFHFGHFALLKVQTSIPTNFRLQCLFWFFVTSWDLR